MMNTHFNKSKVYVDNFEYDEDSEVFVFEVTALNTNYIETHEIPEERAWELLTHYLDNSDLFTFEDGGVSPRTLDDLIDCGLINYLIVQAMYIDNYNVVCASYDDFMAMPDKMKSEHFSAVILNTPSHTRNTWHFLLELFIYKDNSIPNYCPKELTQVAEDLKKQFMPLDDDIIDAFYDNGILHYAIKKEDSYRTLHIDEEMIITSLGKEINRNDDVIDNDGSCIGTMNNEWEFSYRELCEVAKRYGDF